MSAQKRKVDGQNEAANKRKASKRPAVTPFSLAVDGGPQWRTDGTSVIFKRRISKRMFEKVACFDLDKTLVHTKGSCPFPRRPDDWVFFNDRVKAKLHELHDQKFKLVVFSNQAGIQTRLDGVLATRLKSRIDQILRAINLPVDVFLATSKDRYRKPETGMWEFFMDKVMRDLGGEQLELDMRSSFFVGDAAGRHHDHSDSDKKFAENVGLRFMLPEEFFKAEDGADDNGTMDTPKAIDRSQDTPTHATTEDKQG